MNDINQRFQKLKNKKEFLEADKIYKESELLSIRSKYDNLFKARWVLSEVSKMTQDKFKNKVESLMTSVLQSIFNKDIVFELVLESKRNVLTARPILKENGNEFDIKSDRGGSVVDLLSFAFRICLWSMQKPRSRNVFILDEPFKAFGGEMIEKIGDMLQELSKRLVLQFIFITHESRFASIADKTFKIKQEGGISFIAE